MKKIKLETCLAFVVCLQILAHQGQRPIHAQESASGIESCHISDGTLQLGEGHTCELQTALSRAPLILSHLIMGNNSTLRLPNTVTEDNRWEIKANRADIGHHVRIDASGQPGQNGEQGSGGANRGQCAGTPRGGTGGEGGRGTDGLSGRSIMLDIGFSSLGSLVIDTTGGDGGNGGPGGSGGKGRDADVDYPIPICHGGDGGPGGTGGPGGDGGDGGSISVKLDLSASINVVPILDSLELRASGGSFGEHGSSGAGGPGGNGDRSCAPLLGTPCISRGGGQRGAGGANGVNGQPGLGGKPVVVEVGEVFLMSDSANISVGDAGPNEPSDRTEDQRGHSDNMTAACSTLFGHFPRFLSMYNNYLIDDNVHSYVLSNLEKASQMEASGRYADAREAYGSILQDIDTIDGVARSRFREYARPGELVGGLTARIRVLESIIDSAPETRCLGDQPLSEFNRCRSLCIGYEMQGNYEIGTDQEGRFNVGMDTRSSVSVGARCIPECMGRILEAGQYEACDRLIEELNNLQNQIAMARRSRFPTLALEEVLSSSREVSDFSWRGPLTILYEDTTVHVCPQRDMYFGLEYCRDDRIGRPVDRWRSGYTCMGERIGGF